MPYDMPTAVEDVACEERKTPPRETLVRRELARYRKKSLSLGVGVFLLDVAINAASFAILAWLPVFWLYKIPLALLSGVLITRLFIVGHDAAHGALTGSRIADAIIARLAFLPTLHPCSLWQVGHNRVHHSFTNLKGLDFIWIPFSPNEYRNLPPWRRLAERFYRSTPGMGAYYMIEVWWKYLSPMQVASLGRQRRSQFVFWADVALTLSFLAAAILVAGHWDAVLFSVILPFLSWNWTMGFIIYNHHTGPLVRFYDNRRQWRFFQGQVEGTVHTIFPKPLGIFLNNILEHTAHHLDANIPLYRLANAQRRLTELLGDQLIIERWSFRSFRETIRSCQLYDYQRHCWMRFNDAWKGSE
ncbi:MAG TPA: fatty acid desaturase [Bryobacteraceae bacterium]|nr:fatty acid desaturase [Bryobacteraceae bacterium]